MKPVIGLEVHVELKTKSKMFCGCSTDYFGQKPNTHTCPVCLGLPGALPVPNKTAIEWCVMLGMALNCNIPLFSKFDRKNYFYPDLAKGYQISQYDEPFARDGFVILNGVKDPDSSATPQNDKTKKIGITRVHLEEDTGKLTHETVNGEEVTLIDFNRSGVPLIEVVTEPDFDNAEDVKDYLQKLQQIVRYLDISNADMEKGNMRLEPNISIRNKQEEISKKLPKYKVEVKNINSFKFAEKAINFEIKRQTEILESGKTPAQETRGWSQEKQITVTQRIKEEASDYRYFPEPDIPPLRWTAKQLDKFKKQIPELPEIKKNRFINDYEITNYDAEILTREKELADFFEEAVAAGKTHKISPRTIANNIINRKVNTEDLLPSDLIKTIISTSTYAKLDKEKVKKAVKEVLKNNPQAAGDLKAGKAQALQFLIGQTMKSLRENVEARVIIEEIKEQVK